MVELKINRNVLYALLTLVGLVAALGIGIWFGRAGSESTAMAPAGANVPAAAVPPAGAPQSAPEISLGGTAQAVPEMINTPAAGELTPEEDAAVLRLAVADAAAKVGDPNVVFVDTRTDQEFQTGHIQGAVSMPAYTQDAMLETLPKEKEIILYCA
jgi:hypothetical protein